MQKNSYIQKNISILEAKLLSLTSMAGILLEKFKKIPRR